MFRPQDKLSGFERTPYECVHGPITCISKTDYVLWRNCAKNAWLKLHRPEVYYATELTEFEQSVIDAGIEVEGTARGLFTDGVSVTGSKNEAQQKTAELLSTKRHTLFQPVFEKDGLLAAVDVLQFDEETGGFLIHEIKSATRVQEEYLYDLAFQVVLLRKNGLRVSGAFLIHVNPNYVRQGNLDIGQLFLSVDMSSRVDQVSNTVSNELERVRDYLLAEDEPKGPCSCIYRGRSRHCSTFQYSNPDVPQYGIHDIARIGSSPKRLKELVDRGAFTLDEIPADIKLSDAQKMQLRVYRTEETVVNKEAIAREFGELNFPLHFIDYETYAPALPQFDQFAPYDHMPLQYSVHIVGSPGEEPIHRDFLHSRRADPTTSFVHSLQQHGWRVVVFTTRRDTQTTIEAFLQERGVACGLINGDSGERNQRTIAKFKKAAPEVNAIVSTEAGSEGVNLQVANVLVNFDLPWNPMIVEQRIGRIQRLASEHASVCIFNIILRGTFEEYIVGRLMEKLQMASHAIGDIEALLEASGMNDQEEDCTAFEEKIRQLVVASLAGKNVETATHLAEKSITDAKVELEGQEKNINAMLGGMDEAGDEIPYPDLPRAAKSMEPQVFALAALGSLGTEFTRESDGVYASKRDGKTDRICFDEAHSLNAVLYRPGAAAFSRLASRIVANPLHRVQDLDEKPGIRAEAMAREWIGSFGANFRAVQVQGVERSFAGTAVVRVRVTVGHDSYERLVDVVIPSSEHWIPAGITGASPISDPLRNPEAVGLDTAILMDKAIQDEGVAEFCRFYLDRRKQELEAAGTDPRKRKKIGDDFTPQLEAFLVGLEGTVQRRLQVNGTFDFGSGAPYESVLAVVPAENRIVLAPELSRCSLTQKLAPLDCLGRCEISGVPVLKHLLEKSEVSGRVALPEFMEQCAATGKRVLRDELEQSAVTKQMVTKSLLKTSGLTGKRAEPQYFGKCEFSGIEALESELATSQVSGKKYRADRQQRSIVSGKTGYVEEFAVCSETQHLLLPEEAEKCEVTGELVVPGMLERCEGSGKRVLPRELEKSAATGKKALKQFFVSSSISGARFLDGEGVVSATGKHCLQQEAKVCAWSSKKCHPDDLRICQLTRVAAHFEYMTTNGEIRLEPLLTLLNGLRRQSDRPELWARIITKVSQVLDGRSQIESAVSSPNGDHLAVCFETKNWLGLKTRQAGVLYAIRDEAPVGRIVLGKREAVGWVLEKVL